MEKETKVEFQLKDIIPVVALIGIAGIYAAYILKVQADVKDQFVTGTVANCGLNSTGGAANPVYTNCSLEWNASTDAQLGVSNITSNFPTIGLIAAAVIIIGMLSFLLVTR